MPAYLDWIANLGHDTYSYPWWITKQQLACSCRAAPIPSRAICTSDGAQVDWRADVLRGDGSLTFCSSKAWLLEHMPEFDLHYLPGSVTVNATSMLEDVVAFALMADRAAPFSATIPLATKLAYLLPYASYHESRQNWRPLFYAKFFSLVANATTVEEALGRLLAPNVFLQWTEHYWPSSPRQPAQAHGAGADSYHIEWSSSTAPPVVSPFEFIAYGYGSCSAWASFVTYVGRAVGIPARPVGTPCWNAVYEGTDFRGRARANSNVSLCWAGGSRSRGHGGGFLNNHNWVEVFLPGGSSGASGGGGGGGGIGGGGEADGRWVFVIVPPASKTPNTGLCGDDGSRDLRCHVVSRGGSRRPRRAYPRR